MKKLFGCVLAFVLSVGAASASEIYLGGRTFVGYGTISTGANSDEGVITNSALTPGASFFAKFDFVEKGIFTFGIRPELMLGYDIFLTSQNSGSFYFGLRCPAMFEFKINDFLSLGVGAGFAWNQLIYFGPTADVYATFAVGPGQILIDCSFDATFALFILPRCESILSVGYQWKL